MTDINESKEKLARPIPQWPDSPTRSAPARQQRSYFSRRQLAAIGLSFIITASTAGFLGFIAGQKIFANRQTAWQLTPAHRPRLAFADDDSSRMEPVAESIKADTKPVRAKAAPENTAELALTQVVSAATRNDAAVTGKIKTSLTFDTDGNGKAKDVAAMPAVKKDPTVSPWSVQISATQDQTAAQVLQEKLKGKGFDAFIVEAEINSSRWYRVRVGRFNTNQEAETARQDLQSKEKLASAFVTGK